MMVKMRTTRQRVAWISIISCGVLIVVFFGLLSSERSDSLKAVATTVVTSSSPPTVPASEATNVSKDKSAARPSQPSEMAQIPVPETGKKIFELPDGRYLEIIESLKVDAEKSDANASYAIARMLVDCKEVFENNDNRLLERNKPADQNLTAEKKAVLESAEAGIAEDDARRLEKCDGLSQETLSQSTYWLQRAADAGLAEARADYGLYAFKGMTIDDAIREPRKIIGIKERYARYSDEAIASGSSSAILNAAWDYSIGTLRPRNDISAYAHYYAVVLANPALTNSTTLSLYASRLTPEQLVTAQQQGVILSRKIH